MNGWVGGWARWIDRCTDGEMDGWMEAGEQMDRLMIDE
jgi:hypothetical protein